MLGAAFGLVFTAAALVWLDPSSAVPAIVGATLAVADPMAFQPVLVERDLRLRTHQGALGQVTLDALLGLVPLRAHRGQRALTRVHDDLVDEWRRTGRSFQRAVVTSDAVQALAAALVVGWLLASFLPGTSSPGDNLLFVTWALLVPVLGYDLALALRRWPPLRTVLLRLREPLRSPEAPKGEGTGITSSPRIHPVTSPRAACRSSWMA